MSSPHFTGTGKSSAFGPIRDLLEAACAVTIGLIAALAAWVLVVSGFAVLYLGAGLLSEATGFGPLPLGPSFWLPLIIVIPALFALVFTSVCLWAIVGVARLPFSLSVLGYVCGISSLVIAISPLSPL